MVNAGDNTVMRYNIDMATKTKKLPDPSRPDLRLGWHFLPANKTLTYGDGRKVTVGATLSTSAVPSVCARGMHASEKVTDAAAYTRGPVMCRVEVWGSIDTSHSDKFSGQHRKVLWMKQLTKKDIKECFNDIGYEVPDYWNSETPVSSYINQLGCVVHGEEYQDAVEAWLENWAQKNGCPGLKPKTVKKVVLPPELTTDELIPLLSDRYVRTREELETQIGDQWGEDSVDNAFYDLAYDEAVCVVENFTADGDDGYVLRQKKKAAKRK